MNDQPTGLSFVGTYQATIGGPFSGGWSVQVIASEEPIQPPNGKAMVHVTVTGTDLPTTENRSYRYYGQWQTHPKYGLQFRCDMATEELPMTVEGIEAFLASGFVEGIGPVTAERIVDRFGLETFRVIEEEPERLQEIPRLSQKRIDDLVKSFKDASKIREIVTALTPFGVSPKLAVRIMEHFDDPLRVVREAPYTLCGSRIGIGFKTADKIARAQGLQPASMLRYAAGIRHLLRQNEQNGHSAYPWSQLLHDATNLLSIPGELMISYEHMLMTLAQMQRQQMISVETMSMQSMLIDPDAWLNALDPSEEMELYVMNGETFLRERTLGEAIQQHLARSLPPVEDLDRRLEAAEKGLGFTPSEQQREAVRLAAKHPLVVISGVPGSGKTTTLRLLLNTILAKKPLLTAPTGRAARRMAQSTGLEAETLHRALGFRSDDGESEFYQSDETPLTDADLVVVDEMSMTDLALAERLLDALNPHARLVLVGDPDQLPSVGAGQVLGDLLKVIKVPHVKLDLVFRQEEASQIVQDASRIREGNPHLLWGEDVHFCACDSPQEAHDKVIELYKELSQTIEPDELMVLSPMKGRRRNQSEAPMPAGTFALNRDLQEAVNPSGRGTPEIERGQRFWREGDRIMMLRNQIRTPLGDVERDEMVSNGDTGILEKIESPKEIEAMIQSGKLDQDGISGRKGALILKFNGDRFRFLPDEMEMLDHAYAATIHKAQGSEYRVVIIVLIRSHYTMLQRNLIYTALTRAKEQVFIVGQEDAVRIAIQTVRGSERCTLLANRLASLLEATDERHENLL